VAVSGELTHATAHRTRSERLTPAFHSYFVPLAGAEALFLGFLLFFGITGPLKLYVALPLLLGGAGALVGSVGARAWRRAHRLRAQAKLGAARSPPRAQTPSSRDHEAARRPNHRAEWSTPHSGIGRAVASVSTKAGDVLWRQWTVPRIRPLGAELVGPVREAAHSPPPAGGFVPFPKKDRDLVFPKGAPSPSSAPSPNSSPGPAAYSGWGSLPRRVPSPLLPTHRSSRPQPLTEAELDALFPRDVTSSPSENMPTGGTARPGLSRSREIEQPESAVAAPEPPRSGSPSHPSPPLTVTTSAPKELEAEESRLAAAVADIGSPLSGSFGILPTLDAIDHQVYLEAVNPIPPHLRATTPTAASAPAQIATTTFARSGGSMFCAVCAGIVSDFRSWVHCLGCHKPICRRCLKSSFATGGEGLCGDCREQGAPTAG
jgi:hypothetical protein